MNHKRIAVYFDCENVGADYVSNIFYELANYGEVIIRQAYKDWGSNNGKSWEKQIPKFAIKQIQVTPNIS